MLDIFCRTILPRNEATNCPSLSEIDFISYMDIHAVKDEVDEYLSILEQTAQEKFDASFKSLPSPTRLKCIEFSKRKNFRLANNVFVHCLKAYYSHKDVLSKISAGTVPPFPQGNNLDDDDWTLLGSVYERGKLYRLVNNE